MYFTKLRSFVQKRHDVFKEPEIHHTTDRKKVEKIDSIYFKGFLLSADKLSHPHKHLPRDIFRSLERVLIHLVMGEVSTDSKVKHIHKQTFCKRYFF